MDSFKVNPQDEGKIQIQLLVSILSHQSALIGTISNLFSEDDGHYNAIMDSYSDSLEKSGQKLYQKLFQQYGRLDVDDVLGL